MGAERWLDIALESAIEHAGGTVAALRLREPTGREMREAERTLSDAISVESSSAFEIALIGAVSGLPEDVLNKLKISVMHRARQFVTGFDSESGGRRESQPDQLDLALPAPLVSGGVTYERLSLCEPTVGMRRRAETALRGGATVANARHYQIVLVAEASGLPFDVAEQLPVSMLNDAQAYLQGFIQPGRRTGSA